jgi:ABC-type transport system involved in multi-copper enzyme maturation permease subunit
VRATLRGRRAWIVLGITTVFMVLSSANGWIAAQIAASLPPDVVPPEVNLSAVDNLVAAVATQIFVLAAIFAVVSLLVAERQAGTLAWTASKPVSRSAIWLSKWLSASAMLALTAGILPFAATSGLVVVLYGPPPVELVGAILFGIVASVVFFAALGLAAGTVMPGQAAIAATGFGVFAVVPALVGLLPLPLAPFLPTSILSWSLATASGVDAGWVTPVAWAVWTALLVAFGLQRMHRLEL